MLWCYYLRVLKCRVHLSVRLFPDATITVMRWSFTTAFIELSKEDDHDPSGTPRDIVMTDGPSAFLVTHSSCNFEGAACT